MRIRTKLTLSTLAVALLPLAISMGVSLWHGARQIRSLTIESARGHLLAGAESLSGYLEARKAEIKVYARSPLVRTMDWQGIGPYLADEMDGRNANYEKLLLATPKATYYTTSGGNPDLGGLASFDDTDPKARPRTLTNRKYWQYTVGENQGAQPRVYVSDPLISYTTGVRQVVVAATVLSVDGRVLGMVGGTLEWSQIERMINAIREDILRDIGRFANLCLVSHNGAYIYHWDGGKAVSLKLDGLGKPVIDEVGEKEIVERNITGEKSSGLARVGREMIKGHEGFDFYFDPDTGQEMAIVYAPVKSAYYSMALVLPKERILAQVTSLRETFLIIGLVSIVLAVVVSWLISSRVSNPIITLNLAVQRLGRGRWQSRIRPTGSTEVRQLTESFNDMAMSLEKREEALEGKNRELKVLVQDLETKNAELERFTYTVSHDLKSPLITIKGFVGMLETDVASGRMEDVRDDIKEIRGAADKMNSLLDELLELSRIGRLVNPPVEIPWSELTLEAVRLLAGPIANIKARVEVSPDMPKVTGDRPRLLEVIQNLVDNAVKYTGGQQSPTVRIGALTRDSEPVFFVEDNGLGIDPQYHEKIFGLFEKLDVDTEGTGVGLAIVKRILEVHGGCIWVESDGPGRGSVFYFILPAAEK